MEAFNSLAHYFLDTVNQNRNFTYSQADEKYFFFGRTFRTHFFGRTFSDADHLGQFSKLATKPTKLSYFTIRQFFYL
jgi:hypothetical protein